MSPRLKRRTSRLRKSRTSVARKVRIRRAILSRLGIEQPHILDVYCGPGEMWRLAYDRTPAYLGLDKQQYDDERRTIVCENSRFLRDEDADLERFDLFDLDAFASPWYQLAIIHDRINWSRRRRIGFVITDGSWFRAVRRWRPARELTRWLGVVDDVQDWAIWQARALAKLAEMAGGVIEEPVLRNEGQSVVVCAWVLRRNEGLEPDTAPEALW